MIRKLAILIGLGFAGAVLLAFGSGALTVIGQGYLRDPSAAAEFHKQPAALALPSDGPFGRFDRNQLQRGFEVYDQVCKACHSLQHVAFRDLAALGYDQAEIKAIAKSYQVPHYDASTGELTTTPGAPTDHFPPVAYAGTGHPPDLSLITKAREGGAPYVHSLLTGFTTQPAELLKKFPDSKTPDGLYYNPYFANLNIAMPPPLTAEGQVTYADGTPATVNQMATDVSAFLVWTAEPTLEKRRQVGWPVLGFLLFASVLAWLAKRNVWADKKPKKKKS
jgi:ubiquinol-cytochrome c reductase cytochrome c1 subunit